MLSNRIRLMKNNNILKYIKRNIITYRNKNYIEAESNNELEEVKDWLNTTKPKLLCIYFTNNWNPIAIKSNKDYEKFTSQPTSFQNLRVDTDKHPRLKWFFDSKCEPGFQFFYFGNKISGFGGSNFERATKEQKRIQEFVDNQASDRNINNTEYEMPYYEYERTIPLYGNVLTTDPAQTFDFVPFNPFLFSLRTIPFEENWIANRLKK